MDEYAYTSDERRAVIVRNVDEVPDSPSKSVTDDNKDTDDVVLPDDGVTSKRLKVERSDSDDAVLPNNGVTSTRLKVQRS